MELLAPAGNLEKLKWAVIYGADAVYFGLKFGSLRSFAGNFTFEEAAEGIAFLHKHGKKAYLTLNIFPFSDEYSKLVDSASILDEMGADAFIVSDLGVLTELKKLSLKASLHISTQANTTSYQTILAYNKLGAKRANLARELSIKQILEIQEQVNGQVETEVFINGSVCFSYSGRCAISDYLTGFRANHGECKHPCRWKYFLMEESRPGEYMPVFEDQRGLYLFNSKELALFEYVPDLLEAGVSSIKIEGRMKSIHYIATVVSFYRQILDGRIFSRQEGLQLLNRIPNRGYSTGFMKGKIDSNDYQLDGNSSTSNTIFVGNILENKIDNRSILEVRNKIYAGESLEVLAPDGTLTSVTMPAPLITILGRKADYINHSESIILEEELSPYTILRRVTMPEHKG